MSARRAAAGMALIAVLWIVAALSLLVLGVSGSVREQIRTVGQARDQIEGQALAEAAIALVLQQILAQPERPGGIQHISVGYAGLSIEVEAAPLDGLISLNDAPPELLAALLQVAGGLPAGPAQALAATLVEWRDTQPELDITDSPDARQQRRFEAPEDLLLVPGVDYGLYARLAPLVSADLAGTGGRVNTATAPAGVLAVLAQGDAGAVARYLGQRDSGQPGADATGLNPGFAGESGSSSFPLYRMRAAIALDAGKMLHFVQDVALGTGGQNAAPWRVIGHHSQIVSSSAG